MGVERSQTTTGSKSNRSCRQRLTYLLTYLPCACRVGRVRGIKNLRIIDASVIPSSLSGNSYTTQVMIAEKAADMVREKDTVTAIKEYFRHLLEIKHKKIMEEEEPPHNTTDNNHK